MLTIQKSNSISVSRVPQGALSTMEPFRKIPAESLAELEKKAAGKTYAKNEVIFGAEEPADHVWFVKEGWVKETGRTPAGRNLIFCLVGAGGLFGTDAFAGGDYGCEGVAETHTTAIRVPVGEFLDFQRRHPEVSRWLTAVISKRLRRSKTMQAFDTERVGKRLLHVLVDLVGQFGRTIPLTRKEIGEMAGTTVETAIRNFSMFGSEGLVSTSRGKIVIRSVQDLMKRMESFDSLG